MDNYWTKKNEKKLISIVKENPKITWKEASRQLEKSENIIKTPVQVSNKWISIREKNPELNDLRKKRTLLKEDEEKKFINLAKENNKKELLEIFSNMSTSQISHKFYYIQKKESKNKLQVKNENIEEGKEAKVENEKEEKKSKKENGEKKLKKELNQKYQEED